MFDVIRFVKSLDSFELFIFILISLTAIVVISGITYAIYWNIKYKTVYSETKKGTGIVISMNYTPSTTYTSYNGKTFTTHTDPEKNEVDIKIRNVYFKDKEAISHIDSSRLYQLVRIDDELELEYQEKYRVERKNPRNKVLVGYYVVSVINPKGKKWTHNE